MTIKKFIAILFLSDYLAFKDSYELLLNNARYYCDITDLIALTVELSHGFGWFCKFNLFSGVIHL